MKTSLAISALLLVVAASAHPLLDVNPALVLDPETDLLPVLVLNPTTDSDPIYELALEPSLLDEWFWHQQADSQLKLVEGEESSQKAEDEDEDPTQEVGARLWS